MVWPGEDSFCCRGGKHILGPEFNPPINDEYLSIIRDPSFSANSRTYNQQLAFASVLTTPTKAQGGLGFSTDRGGFLHLYGKVYACFFDPHDGPSGIDSYRVPDDFIVTRRPIAFAQHPRESRGSNASCATICAPVFGYISVDALSLPSCGE
jgi:hypothetical protein